MKNGLRINMNFDGDWIEKKRYDYENPVRLIEGFVKNFGKTHRGAELIVCSYNFMCLQIEEELWTLFTEQLEAFVWKMFDEENFWEYVQLERSRADWSSKTEDTVPSPRGIFGNMPRSEGAALGNSLHTAGAAPDPSSRTELAGLRIPEFLMSTPSQQQMKPPVHRPPVPTEGGSPKRPLFPWGPAPKPSSSTEEAPEGFGLPGDDRTHARIPGWDTLGNGENFWEEEYNPNNGCVDSKQRVEEIYTSLLKRHQVLSDCPPLLNYLAQMKKLALTMKEMQVQDCIWTKKLLVSMDAGFGFSTFLQAVNELLEVCFPSTLLGNSNGVGEAREYTIENKKNGEYTSWEATLNSMKGNTSFLMDRNRCCRVVAVDLTEWQDELGEPRVQGYLKKMAEAALNYLCVFRIQLFEESKVRELERLLANVMLVETVIAYPPSIEAMAEYLSRQVEKKGFSVLPRNWDSWDMQCDPKLLQEWNSKKPLKLLEQWISEEKRKTYFSGYQSLNLMAERLIYKKAEINVRKGEYSKVITAEDMYEVVDTAAETENPWDELDALIGMQSVKREIRKMVTQLKAIKNPSSRPTFHMAFVGNPGTGKTTVARILSKILEKEKLLTKGRYLEVHGRDLCGEHVGATSIRTKQYCRDAYGSVLFIDEAYSLYSEKDSKDFGREAVAVLIQQMENHRQDMCVILAGYQDDINDLLGMNDGFRGRLRLLEFPNYSRQELVQIFFKYLEADRIRMGLRYDETVLRETVEQFFLSTEFLPEERLCARDFSNARFIRNLYEQVRGEAVCRTGLDAAVTLEIKKEDFENASGQFLMIEEQKKTRIGFGI